MIRALWSGVSGLTAHQTRMDVIGNNIANVNTYGFKASRTSFSDIYYQAKKSATGGYATYAGNNESAVGYGVEVSSIDKDMSTSSFQSTNRVLDLALKGNGFFMTATVDENKEVNNVNYTRYGGFGVDSSGNLVNTLNRFVLGINNDGDYSDANLNSKDVPQDPKEAEIINVNDRIWDAFRKYTTNQYKYVAAKYKGTAPITIPADKQTIFDTTNPYNTTETIAWLGGSDAVGGTAPTMNADTDDLLAANTTDQNVLTDYLLYYVNGKYVNVQGVVYDADVGYFVDNEGNYYSYDAKTDKNEAGEITKTYTYTRQTLTFDAAGKLTNATAGAVYTYDEINKVWEGTDAAGNSIFADMELSPVTYDDLEGFAVEANGTLMATYAGQIKKLGRVLVATFDNPEGLDQIGETAFGESAASGAAVVKIPGTYGSGKVASTKLEMSNVNLANEFSDMIVTQRGFQANARIITTSDSMLEELVNMKR